MKKKRKTRKAGVRQITGIPADHDVYLCMEDLATYCSLSRRRLQGLVYDPHDPLPSYRLGAKLLVRRSEFDAWMARHRNQKAQALTRLAAADAQALLSARSHNIL